jgi:hypothetical protein
MFFALCAAEAGIFLSLLSLYRAATRPDLWSFFMSTPGRIFASSCIVTVFSLGVITHTVRKSVPANRRQVALAISMNLLMVVLTIGSTELLARVLSKQTRGGETLFGVLLYPKEWSQFATYYRQMADDLVHEGSYLIHDPMLGWTVGASRTDRTGLYSSSAEGLRSPHAGMSFADLRVRHSGASASPASLRIALIGDSMTQGHEVRCEESWGHRLEALLQPQAQVLNFAVVGHGLTQTLLRYEKDVRPWKPHIVIIGITSSMIKRGVNVYPFLQNPEWGNPFARPRWGMREGVLTAISETAPDATQIFATGAITDVPALGLDDYYRVYQWERGGIWYLLERSYIFRFAYSLRSPADDREEERNLNALQLGQVVGQRLVREILQDGAIPLVVTLPYKEEVPIPGESKTKDVPLSARMLRNAGIQYFDSSACLLTIKVSDAYLKGSHYSPEANARIAGCLRPLVRKIFDGA